MTIQNMLVPWDWPTAFGLVMVGLILGYVLIQFAWPARRASGEAYPGILAGVIGITAGVTFFTFLTTFRLLTHLPNAERTITTGIQWTVFSVALSAGLELRGMRR